MYDALLFDVDGVLLGFPPDPSAYREANAAAFRTFGAEPSDSELAVFTSTGKTVEQMREVCERHGVSFPELWAEREARSAALQRRMMVDGERELYDDHTALDDLAADHSVGLVSSNQQETVDFVVEHFGLGAYVDAAHGRDPTVEGFCRIKPDPYYVERALADLGGGEALLVGDSESDVRAADAAGIDSAFVWRPHREGYELDADPTYEIENLGELRAALGTEA